jgi:hypothetical protein
MSSARGFSFYVVPEGMENKKVTYMDGNSSEPPKWRQLITSVVEVLMIR